MSHNRVPTNSPRDRVSTKASEDRNLLSPDSQTTQASSQKASTDSDQEDSIDIVRPIGTSAVPLIRFDAQGRPIAQEQGLELLRVLPRPLKVVVFLGKGRCGKSTTLNQLASDDMPQSKHSQNLFGVGNTVKPMTHGADMAAVQQVDGSYILYIDCEGSNNPISQTSSNYHVLSMLACVIASQIVHCDLSSIGEHSLDDLGAIAASRDMIMTTDAGQYTPDLIALVMQSHSDVPEGHLADLIKSVHVRSCRGVLRNTVDQAFRSKQIRSIPHLSALNYHDCVRKLRRELTDGSLHVQRGGVVLDGAGLAELLTGVCEQVGKFTRSRTMKVAIEPDAACDRVVKARLQAVSRQCVYRYWEALRSLEDFRDDMSNARKFIILNEFDLETSSITSNMKQSVREELRAELLNIDFVTTEQHVDMVQATFENFLEEYVQEFVPSLTKVIESCAWLSSCLTLQRRKPISTDVDDYLSVNHAPERAIADETLQFSPRIPNSITQDAQISQPAG